MKIRIKYSGGLRDLEVDVQQPALELKSSIHQVTGIPVDRMKVMVKGGILRDTTDLNSLGWSKDSIITVIGTAGPLPSAPSKPALFLEDMDSAAILHGATEPVGLFNLGQTCYLNSSLQMLRSITQIPSALSGKLLNPNSPEGRLATSIKSALGLMSNETNPVMPIDLLSSLRALAPQFAERDARGQFAQQDADEAWTQIINSLRASVSGEQGSPSFIDDIMGLKLRTSQRCLENAEEPVTEREDTILKLECNISISTNFLVSGIQESLDQQVEKASPSLGRSAMYQHQSRLSRLPQYLPIHMVRFYWRRDIQKKAKIMRKVKFPLQLDISDLMTDDLRTHTRAVNTAVKRISADREDRIRRAGRDRPSSNQQEEEVAKREKEREEVRSLSADLDANRGFAQSGLYELCGMVTHKGASADSGHYIGWTRKDDTQNPLAAGQWYKFDDDKVSTVTPEQILALDGGGEDSVAYLLLYRAVVI